MAEVGFYHLQHWGLDQALPKLLERILQRNMRAVVLAPSDERVEAMNRLLWTFDQDSFLPHGTRGDGHVERQPIFLAAGFERPNEAQVLVLVDGAEHDDLSAFERCIDLFDGNDPQAVAAARQRWRQRVQQGHELTYWKQGETGGWKKAHSVKPAT